MRVESIVQRLCEPTAGDVHASRVETVIAAATAVVWAGRLSVSRVGRALRGSTAPKHSIKRVDRLLSNHRMWSDRCAFFRALATKLLGAAPSPKVLIDWTKLVGGNYALVAAVPIGGRALPIYIEVHPERLLGNPKVQGQFLEHLAEVLPVGVVPVVVADAGFRTPFLAAVLALGWNFVVRLRGRLTPRYVDGGEARPAAAMLKWATEDPLDLDSWQLSSRGIFSMRCRLVLASRPRKRGRSRGKKPSWNSERKAARGAKEPWLLATSLEHVAPASIVKAYAARMQIEEIFRDTKNERFGWALIHSRSASHRRLDVLLLLAAIAATAVVLCGLAAERLGLQRGYQANTVKRRALSLFALGVAVVARLDARVSTRSVLAELRLQLTS